MLDTLHKLLPHGWIFVPFLLGQFGFDFGNLGSILEGYLIAFLNFLLQIVVFIWNVLVYVANYIWAALNFVAKFFYTLFEDVKKAFGWLWDNVVKAGLTKAVKTFFKVRAWLTNLFAPLLKWIKILRAWYDQYFNQFVKPVLKIVRQLRQILGIFKLLGFKWAARLDADLARIENKIVALYVTLRQYLNIATSWIQLIVDPLGILRRNPLFAAIIRSAAELQNVMDRATQRDLTGKEADSAKQDARLFTKQTLADDQTNYFSKGKLPPCYEESRQRFLVELKGIQDGNG